jgi:hypothetical protein
VAPPVELLPAPDPLDGVAETWDRTAVAAIAQMTRGLSPAMIGQVVSDWAIHLACSPGAEEWRDRAPVTDGSWWEAWLAAHSGPFGDRPPMGTPNGFYAPIADAPGHYVLEH